MGVQVLTVIAVFLGLLPKLRRWMMRLGLRQLLVMRLRNLRRSVLLPQGALHAQGHNPGCH